jgi:D-alanyl-D-alanine carboxypeptidase/D-alanyl-D-alanine-endopeptidase (penicillin-binding protein 4)
MQRVNGQGFNTHGHLRVSTKERLRTVKLIACAMLMMAPLALAQSNELSDDVRRLIGTKKWDKAKVGVSLYDVTTSTVLANVRADEALIPASNMKVLTSGAALMILGPDFAFKTQVILDGQTLIIKGDGDPSLADPAILDKMDPKMTVSEMLGTLANAVGKTGTTSITGLIIDDRVFDRQLVHPSWPVDQLSRGYCAQVCGVNFHANVLHVFPAPGPDGPGTPAIYTTQPAAPWLALDVRSRTVREGNNSAWLTREEGNKFTLRGDVRHKSLSPIEVTFDDPAMFFGRCLADQLSGAGIQTDLKTVRLATENEDLSKGRVVAVITTPIAEVIKRCNTDSENLYAESLLKRIGHAVAKEPGSWTNGAAVLRMLISEKIGAGAAAGTIISDGSGMSRENAVSPATLTRWLAIVANDKTIAEPFHTSMATVGTGTLRRRFQGAKLKNTLAAKSGFINGVRTLSGYVTNPETGRQVAFSVMINDIRGDHSHTSSLELHEEVVQLADRWLTQRVAADSPKVGG